MSADRPIWYFAYGSNLDPGTFLGRRRIRPLHSEIARLDDWSLCFDLPIGPGERGVGNVRQEPGSLIWGVAYELESAEAARLDSTEGVPGGAYRRVSIRVTTTSDDALSAFTYHSPRGVAGRKPSRRYLGLLLTGARHHGLPAEWIDSLRATPLAIDERDNQLELPIE